MDDGSNLFHLPGPFQAQWRCVGIADFSLQTTGGGVAHPTVDVAATVPLQLQVNLYYWNLPLELLHRLLTPLCHLYGSGGLAVR